MSKKVKKNIWGLGIKIRKFLLYKILRKNTYGVRVIIRHSNEILLIRHHYDDFWTLPGGGIKKKENPQDAAIRESFEEVGIKIESKNLLKLLGKYNNFFGRKKDTVYVYVYRVENCDTSKNSSLKKSIKTGIEIEKANWFKFESLPKISLATEKRILELINDEYEVDQIRDWN